MFKKNKLIIDLNSVLYENCQFLKIRNHIFIPLIMIVLIETFVVDYWHMAQETSQKNTELKLKRGVNNRVDFEVFRNIVWW
jgi:hypothetical protein